MISDWGPGGEAPPMKKSGPQPWVNLHRAGFAKLTNLHRNGSPEPIIPRVIGEQ
jgi:hypothetical protein